MVDFGAVGSICTIAKDIMKAATSHSASVAPAGAISDPGLLLSGMRQIAAEAVVLGEGWFCLPAVGPSYVACYPRKDVVEDEAQKHIDEFYRKKAELLPAYGGKYVAFRDGRVLDTDSDRVALAKRFYRTYGYIAVCISKVEEKKRVVRAPTPRPKR